MLYDVIEVVAGMVISLVLILYSFRNMLKERFFDSQITMVSRDLLSNINHFIPQKVKENLIKSTIESTSEPKRDYKWIVALLFTGLVLYLTRKSIIKIVIGLTIILCFLQIVIYNYKFLDGNFLVKEVLDKVKNSLSESKEEIVSDNNQ